MKEQLTCFDVEEAKKASSMKPSVSNCESLMHAHTHTCTCTNTDNYNFDICNL